MTRNSRFGGGRIYEDRKVPCRSCGSWYVFTVEEQKALDRAGERWPRTCPACRPKSGKEPR